MTPEQIRLVTASFELVKPIAGEAVADFYRRLFTKAPHLRPMFPEDMAEQRKKLVMVLATAVGSLDRFEQLEPVLSDLGARHAGYGVEPAHYAVVGAALLETLEAGLAEFWKPEVAEAWAVAYHALSGAMLAGAGHAQASKRAA